MLQNQTCQRDSGLVVWSSSWAGEVGGSIPPSSWAGEVGGSIPPYPPFFTFWKGINNFILLQKKNYHKFIQLFKIEKKKDSGIGRIRTSNLSNPNGESCH